MAVVRRSPLAGNEIKNEKAHQQIWSHRADTGFSENGASVSAQSREGLAASKIQKTVQHVLQIP